MVENVQADGGRTDGGCSRGEHRFANVQGVRVCRRCGHLLETATAAASGRRFQF